MEEQKRMSSETEEEQRKRMKRITMEAIRDFQRKKESTDPKVQAELKRLEEFWEKNLVQFGNDTE